MFQISRLLKYVQEYFYLYYFFDQKVFSVFFLSVFFFFILLLTVREVFNLFNVSEVV